MSAKHTPTPWAVTHNKRMGCFTIHHTAWCERGQTSKIAAPLISLEDDTDQANAEFIVRAVNAHDDLVAALKALDADWTEAFPSGPDADDLSYELGHIHPKTIAVWRAARAALAKAEAL